MEFIRNNPIEHKKNRSGHFNAHLLLFESLIILKKLSIVIHHVLSIRSPRSELSISSGIWTVGTRAFCSDFGYILYSDYSSFRMKLCYGRLGHAHFGSGIGMFLTANGSWNLIIRTRSLCQGSGMSVVYFSFGKSHFGTGISIGSCHMNYKKGYVHGLR